MFSKRTLLTAKKRPFEFSLHENSGNSLASLNGVFFILIFLFMGFANREMGRAPGLNTLTVWPGRFPYVRQLLIHFFTKRIDLFTCLTGSQVGSNGPKHLFILIVCSREV